MSNSEDAGLRLQSMRYRKVAGAEHLAKRNLKRFLASVTIDALNTSPAEQDDT
jgi:hypothetical protein